MRRVALVGVAVGGLILAPGVGFAHASSAHHYSYAKVRVDNPQGHRVVAAAVYGVTSSGAIAGTIVGPRLDQDRAFLKPAHGRTVFIKVKGFSESLVQAASADGTLAVSVFKSNGSIPRAYRRARSGRLQRINLPGADTGGDAITGINNHGDMVVLGWTAQRQSRSFVRRHGHWRTFRLKGHPASSTYVEGINDHGTIVGSYADSDGVEHGFIDRQGRVQVVTLPDAGVKDGRGSQVRAISDDGIWVGAAITDGNTAEAISYVHHPGHTLQQIRYPKAPATTFVESVNDAGVVVGEFNNGGGSTVGFVAKPR
jgi:uncharacterized membrane protein